MSTMEEEQVYTFKAKENSRESSKRKSTSKAVNLKKRNIQER